MPKSPVGCGGTCMVSCAYTDNFPWFVNAGGGDLTGTHPYRNPSAGSVSGPFRGVVGLEFTGGLDGRATGTPGDYAWEVVFFHEQKCYSGGNEFGFRRDAVTGAFQFYWSINSNCGLDNPPSASVCRSSRGTGAHVQESTGAINLHYGAGPNKYRAHVSIDPKDGKQKFFVELFEPSTAARPWTAWVDPNAPGNWFRSPADSEARFPAEALPNSTGYVTVGIQRSATSTLHADKENPLAVHVQSLRVATAEHSGNASIRGRVTVTVRSGVVITDASFAGYKLHIEREVNWLGSSGAKIALLQGSHSVFAAENGAIPQLHVWKGNELIVPDDGCCETKAAGTVFDSTVEVARDVTGDGVPELLLTEEPAAGGNAAPTLWTVFSLGTLNRVVDELSEGTWRYLPGQRMPVFDTGESWPFWGGAKDQWCFCHWCIGTPVTLRYRDGAFRLAKDLMSKPKPSAEELSDYAAKMPAAGADDCPSDTLPNKMLELIFSGNAAGAFQFFEIAWPGDSKAKRDFRSAFLARLEQSGYCQDLVRDGKLGGEPLKCRP
jgi:hypothetical protein